MWDKSMMDAVNVIKAFETLIFQVVELNLLTHKSLAGIQK